MLLSAQKTIKKEFIIYVGYIAVDSSFNESKEVIVKFKLADLTAPNIIVSDIYIKDSELEVFDVLDNIDIDFCCDDEIAQAVENFKDYIKSETLALEINRVDDESLEKHNLNDHMTGIKVTRK